MTVVARLLGRLAGRSVPLRCTVGWHVWVSEPVHPALKRVCIKCRRREPTC